MKVKILFSGYGYLIKEIIKRKIYNETACWEASDRRT
jgi:hypothetical protein